MVLAQVFNHKQLFFDWVDQSSRGRDFIHVSPVSCGHDATTAVVGGVAASGIFHPCFRVSSQGQLGEARQ